MWGMDILGPLPKAPGEFKYLLVAIDYTKWTEARPLREIITNEDGCIPNHFSKGSSNPRSALGESRFSKGSSYLRSTLGEPRKNPGQMHSLSLLQRLIKPKVYPWNTSLQEYQKLKVRPWYKNPRFVLGTKTQGPSLVRIPTKSQGMPLVSSLLGNYNKFLLLNDPLATIRSLARLESIRFLQTCGTREHCQPIGLRTESCECCVPGLNTLGVSMSRIDYAPKGLNPPHTHPRGTEMLMVMEGTLFVGFVSSNQDNNRLFSKVLNKGDVFVFPIGLIHFQYNVGKGNAVAITAFSSQNAGVIGISSAVFLSTPPIPSEILAKGFQVGQNIEGTNSTKVTKQQITSVSPSYRKRNKNESSSDPITSDPNSTSVKLEGRLKLEDDGDGFYQWRR
ncbi:hypothetical protein JHK85_053915 [Glycine max]|nr:hypothetical protein JHK85_053915 [Glycine max]